MSSDWFLAVSFTQGEGCRPCRGVLAELFELPQLKITRSKFHQTKRNCLTSRRRAQDKC